MKIAMEIKFCKMHDCCRIMSSGLAVINNPSKYLLKYMH